MKPQAFVGIVTDVQPHPDNETLRNPMDIVTISGNTNVATRLDDGSPRYKIGDFAVMLTENLILPDWLIKHLGMWDETKNKGMLAGKSGNRLKSRAIGIDTKILSQVALVGIEFNKDGPYSSITIVDDKGNVLVGITGYAQTDPTGVDMAWMLGINELYVAN